MLYGAYEDMHYVHVLTMCEGIPLSQRGDMIAQRRLPRRLLAYYTKQLASAVDQCHSNGQTVKSALLLSQAASLELTSFCAHHDVFRSVALIAGIAHCAINLDNVFVTGSGTEAVVKLGGFEASQLCPAGGSLFRKIVATPYTAPEVQQGAYTLAADLWSLGSVLYCLMNGRPPVPAAAGKCLIPSPECKFLSLHDLCTFCV